MEETKKVIKPTSKVKKFFKRAAIISSIAAGALGIAYATIPGVKETINQKIFEVIVRIVEGNKTKLSKVENLQYNEAENLLTFDPVEKAEKYAIKVTSGEDKDFYFTNVTTKTSTKVIFDKDKEVVTGQTIKLHVRAIGDDVKTSDSDVSIIEHEMKYISQRTYNISARHFFEPTKKIVRKLALQEINLYSFDQKDGFAYISGNGIDPWDRKNNFKIEFDLEKLKIESRNLNQLIDLSLFADNARYIEHGFESNLVHKHIDVNKKLIEDGVFEHYTEDGFTVESLQYENGDMAEIGENEVEINHKGMFRASKGEERIDFEQDFTIKMDKVDGYTITDYLVSYNAGEEANVVLENEYKMDEITTKHLFMMEKYLDYDIQSEINMEQQTSQQKNNFYVDNFLSY